MRFQSGVEVKNSPAKTIASTRNSGIQSNAARSVPFFVDVAYTREKLSGMRKYKTSIAYHTTVFCATVLVSTINAVSNSTVIIPFLFFCVFVIIFFLCVCGSIPLFTSF